MKGMHLHIPDSLLQQYLSVAAVTASEAVYCQTFVYSVRKVGFASQSLVIFFWLDVVVLLKRAIYIE